ncbi:hypothetical protein SAY87_017626 [Trapa incisa]|uniref:Plant/F9H3-4 protein n=1 Tax=Trapa incisa TaxID=236973 RepID=A0AAN7QS22_9MYRT|nr:hypothetical protein SAY87_017626 [Trapa incisa]
MAFRNHQMMHSNLSSFLRCTTPTVRSQFLSKTDMRGLNRLWYPWEREKVDYFTLSDFWHCYDEWSAYGAGVPILTNGETLVQYYVPYLSAIQIFTSRSSLSSLREEADAGDCEARDSFSDSWTDVSSSEDGGSEADNSWPLNDRLGHLYLQYFEKSAPYVRVPLMDKIHELARRHPGLMSLRSVDLSPASWMAVAWYPIYHIPMGRTIKDLSTCFLTYHTLSSSFEDMDCMEEGQGMDECDKVSKRKEELIVKEGIPVPPFGLASYKMQGNVWVPPGSKSWRDHERLTSLLSVADSWLKQLQVQHHDFDYFMGSRRS